MLFESIRKLGRVAFALVAEGGGVDRDKPIIVSAGDTFVAVPTPAAEQ